MPQIFPDLILPGVPSPLIPPADYATAGNVTLPARVNFFRNLTVNSGHTLTCLGGGTIIVVQQTLTVVSTGVISANGLGSQVNAAANGGGGGGGAYGRAAVLTRSSGAFISFGAVSASNPYVLAPGTQNFMAAGSAGGAAGVAGGNGGAWPLTGGGAFDASNSDPQEVDLVLALLDLIRAGNGKDDATYGAIGGGAGGNGGVGQATAGSAGAAGNLGGIGGQGTSGNRAGGGGGSGFGGGGGGGGAGTTSGTGGQGGRGGGVILIICGFLTGTGTISANGNNGSAGGASNGGSGGGGGGGAVVVGYHQVDGAGSPTVQANGGTGPAGTGTGTKGGNGGAGIALKFLFSVGA